ncbi:MAG: GDSL-type esterase/lipase family protein [Candidatus Promineifilaceae bacterium]|nr:GDSL-type esterase/lipase family protein [Candidatus Promineifilaceae bacterium]
MSDRKKMAIRMRVIAETRHPQDQMGYDDQEHRYKSDYVQPENWKLQMCAQLPPGCLECEWRIMADESSFSETFEQDGEFETMGELTAVVPAPGPYTIRLLARTNDGDSYQTEEHFHFHDYLVVALGDSYFCGEGNPDVPGKPAAIAGKIACNLATFTKFLEKKLGAEVPTEEDPVWQEKLVHRSYKSGASLAVRQLENGEKGQVITFLNFARTGAAIDDGFLVPRAEDDWTTLGQIEEAQQTIGSRPINALLISVGGNDIQFSDRIIDLLRDDLPIVGDGGLLGDDALNREKEYAEAMLQLQRLPAKLDRLAEKIAELSPEQVFIAPYPVAQFDIVTDEGEVTTSSGCGIFDGPDMDIDEKDAQLMKKTGHMLNDTLRQAAERHGWHVVEGIVEGFAGHGRCSDDSYFCSAQESCEIQGDFRGTLHPNEKGIQVYARCIAAALKEHMLD